MLEEVGILRGPAVDARRGPALDAGQGPALDTRQKSALDARQGPALDARQRLNEKAQDLLQGQLLILECIMASKGLSSLPFPKQKGTPTPSLNYSLCNLPDDQTRLWMS